MIPKYKDNYLSSVGVLFRTLQNIEIYVEDNGSEEFYLEILNRIVPTTIKIVKIIPLNGYENTIRAAKSYDHSFPRIFIVDGDFKWFDEEIKDPDRVWRHGFYCIENILFCQEAASTIIKETIGNISSDNAKKILDWETIYKSDVLKIFELFVVFSLANKIAPEIATVSRKLSSFISQSNNEATVDYGKIDNVIHEILTEINKKLPEINITDLLNEQKIKLNPHSDKIISGKDFLLPLLDIKLKRVCKAVMTKESRNYRLAKHCNLENISGLTQFMTEEISRWKSNQVTKSL